MKRRVKYLIVFTFLLPLGCDDPSGPAVEPSPFCGEHPDTAIPTFEDANLEAAIRTELWVGAQEDLTCGLVSGLTRLSAQDAQITSLVGIENLTGLTTLYLWGNSISDISALSGLTGLRILGLGYNSITDISALSGLTNLTYLALSNNSITDIGALSGLTGLTWLYLNNNPNLADIQPLLDNTGLGAGDTVILESTGVSCIDVAALQAKGVLLVSDCP